MANGIYNVNYIWPGMKLVIPNCHGASYPPPYHPPVADCVTYVVQPGDTLYSIAQRYGTTVYALAHANNIVNPWYITVGTKLIICPKYGYGMYPHGGDYAYQAYHGYKYYVVKPGDTVYSIAMYYGVAPQAIVYLNHLANPYTILVGQKLRIP
ncbi:MAG: LysM domain-containing protein, partial [Anaerolineae bacterium]